MKNINPIVEIWGILDKEKSIGLVKRLYSSDTPIYIYCTFQYPERYYGVAFTFSETISIDISTFDNLRELKVMLLSDTTFENSRLLIIQLLHTDYRDIFSSLCENLIQSISKIDGEEKICKTIVNQLEKWKMLFERDNSTELSFNEQQGLFGELQFLQKLLVKTNTTLYSVLNSWVGVDK
jgi:hypothetical protein